MSGTIARWCIIASLVIGAAFSAPANARVTDDDIQTGIKKLIEVIYSQQNAQGIWDPPEPAAGHEFGTNWGGHTALFTYALLTAGESYQKKEMQRAIEFLKKESENEKSNMKSVYGIGLRAHVWAALPPQFEKYLKDDMYWLSKACHDDGRGGMGFHYTQEMKSWDNSVSQYGFLGLWEAAKRGHQVNTGIWQGGEKHFIETQVAADGGWNYAGTGPGTPSMTAAGLAVLYITQDYLHTQDFRTPGNARRHKLQEKINAGLEYFNKNFAPLSGPQPWYAMYGVERVGVASGVKYFNGKDWYAEGAEAILQRPGGGPDLAFSLLFLVRGRVPVLINKLQIPDYDWNNRPRDMARLTEWVSDEVENRMNWQVVDIGNNPEDWLDAPMLYLASHEELKLTDEQEKKLRRFMDLGGVLVTTADSSSYKFNKSIDTLAEKLYPGLKFAPIKEDDPLMNLVFNLRSEKAKVLSLHNGVRHVWIHLPAGDISWVLHSASHTDSMPWQLFVNTYFYATEKGHASPRMAEHFVLRRGAGGGGAKVAVGRAKYEGTWNPEPLAWEVQSSVMFNNSKADATTKEVDLSNLPKPQEVPFVHVVGTTSIDFSEAQSNSIKTYVDAGGIILFENAGGRGTFHEGVSKMLAKIYPGKPLKPISPSSPIVTGKDIGGENCKKIGYRTFALLRMGQVDQPRLMEVASPDGNPRIIVSAEDLTSGMLNRPVWGIFGYDSASAQKLMTNIVLYANAKGGGKLASSN